MVDKMENGIPNKLMKLSELLPSQAAIDIVNNAKKYYNPNGPQHPITMHGDLIEWNALEIVTIHIVFCKTDLAKSKRSFKPKLAHQIFGQKEKMSGYLFPKIHLYFLANSAKCLLKFTHKGICKGQTDIINAKIFDNLISWLPEDYVTNETRFAQEIENEHHTKMFGKRIMEFKLYNCKEKKDSKFIICECSATDPGFIEFHSRFQCLVVWYIDAVNQLDLNDPNWLFIYVYEEVYVPHLKQNGYYPVGYAAIYKFFHYPDKIRARISQCFILPCCQRMGVGYKLLVATYQTICGLPNVADITVEDPCPAFQRLRDTVDSTLLRELDCFKYPLIKNGFTKKMMNDANNVYKINKRQCRRIYHILRMAYALLSGDNEEYETLLNDVQNFMGIAKQDAFKTNGENEALNGISEILQQAKMPAVEMYTSEIHPVAWRICELLKKEKI